MINDRSAPDLALRALRDCGRIRAPMIAEGLCHLWAFDFAEALPVPGDSSVRDFVLNERGRELAAKLQPWKETR